MKSDRYVPVHGYPNLVRDVQSNAILNMDRTALEQARRQKEQRKLKKLEEQQFKEKINTLENDISEIKEALKILLSKNP